MNRRRPHPQIAAWLLVTRVTAPRQMHSMIRRPRIMKALNAARRAPIVILTAPPGFGKSAAFTQWLGTLSGGDARAAWLTLDAEDDTESTIRYLAFAFHVSGLDVSRTHLLDDTVELPRPRARALQSLLACVEQSKMEWILVIDDLEAVSPTVASEVFQPLVRFMPRTLTLSLATRNATAVDLADPKGRGLITTIGARELRFDLDELRAVWGRSATASQIRMVERRSAGWPALVQLMREHGATPHFGDGGVSATCVALPVTHFFESRVLQRLDDRTLELVLRLSLLPSYTVAVVSVLWGEKDTEAAIDTLTTLGIVSELADDPLKLTVHPLFREYLAERFVAKDPKSALKFRYAAAREYLRRGYHVEAVQVAVATADDDFIGDIVEACDPLVTWITQGLSRLRQLVRLVPDAVARRRPRVGYACVICWVKAGKLKDAQRLFDTLEALEPRDRFHGLEELRAAAVIERALCKSMLAIYKGTPISTEEVNRLDSLVAQTHELAPILRSLAATLRCLLLQHAGQFGEAKDAALQALQYADDAHSAYAAFFVYCDLGMINGVEGATAEAIRLFQKGDSACKATVRADERLSLVRDAFKLELEHEIDPESATTTPRLRNICVRLPRLEGWLDVFAAVYRTYSEKLFLAGDLPAALATLAVGVEHLREQEIEKISTILLAQRVFLLACSGHVADANAEMDELTKGQRATFASTLRSWRELETFVEARAALDLAQRGCGSLPLLAEQILHSQRCGNLRSELRFRRLRMAFPSVRSRSTHTREDDTLRANQLQRDSGFRRAAVLADRWLTVKSAPPPMSLAAECGSQTHPDFFTPREISVLTKLDEALTDKSIAIALGITAHGVRYHLKRIYAKLNARDRSEARAKARRLGIVGAVKPARLPSLARRSRAPY
jgi:LuxR family maltose regulon positive regulatory protein